MRGAPVVEDSGRQRIVKISADSVASLLILVSVLCMNA